MQFYCIFIFVSLLSKFQTRPTPQQRKYYDPCVDQAIKKYSNKMSPQLFQIFQNAFPNTLDTTIQHFEPQIPLTYVITGDIPAMWLRDSTNQIIPYLRLKQQCPKIKILVQGVINMQARFLMVDPYTNAFMDFGDPSRPFYLNDKSFTNILGIQIDLIQNKKFSTKRIWQRKFQIDSLANFLRLLYQYSTRYNTEDFINIEVVKALKRVISVIQEQFHDDLYERKNSVFYKFLRIQNQLYKGKIMPSSKIGLVRSGFRPSDDPNRLPYNIPGNAMLSVYLKKIGLILSNLNKKFYKKITANMAEKMLKFSEQIRQSILQHGIFYEQRSNSKIFAYQIDGKGKKQLYDDANMPSLLSLPLIQFIDVKNEIYQNTRKYILSKLNPFYFQSDNKILRGVGSSHTPAGSIWPLSIITQALTTEDDKQISLCLDSLKKSSVRNLIHESFNVINPISITREWFAWGNSYFGELMLSLVIKKPHLVK